MTLKPFDPERWKAGDPVRCRDERYKILQLIHEPTARPYHRLIAFLTYDGLPSELHTFYDNGTKFTEGVNGSYDIMMAPKKTIWWERRYRGLGGCIESLIFPAVVSDGSVPGMLLEYRKQWLGEPFSFEVEE